MTNCNCIVPVQLLQEIDTLANVILSMSQHYPLPEPLENMVQELNSKAESLQLHGLLNQVTLKPTLARIPFHTA